MSTLARLCLFVAIASTAAVASVSAASTAQPFQVGSTLDGKAATAPPHRHSIAHLVGLIPASSAPYGRSAISARSSHAYVGYPSSIAVLGHSGATGESSDPSRPHVEVRSNSWATGTNPAVNSVYLRILAKNTAIAGHNFNLAQGGATVQQLVFQAKDAISLQPKPDLILIQIMDNDILCPATTDNYKRFLSTFESALAVLAKGLPDSNMFVVSQFGSPGTYAKALPASVRRTFGGTGLCDFVDPKGRIVWKKVARLDKVIHGYEAQLAAGCKQFSQCRYDGGAFGNIIDKRQYISATDPNHFSIKGHAKAAAVAWAALQRAGLIPRNG